MGRDAGDTIGGRPEHFADGPRLLADIGGTHARFVLETSAGSYAAVCNLLCADFAALLLAVRQYLGGADAVAAGAGQLRHAAIAIAYPVDGDTVKMMNGDWEFSIEEMRRALGLETLLVVNDFTALAMALPHLRPDECMQLGGGSARAGSVIGLIGSGTGLGVSGLVPSEDGWTALASEGGHVSFAPCDQREMEVLAFAWREWRHVSAERLLSGRGLELIYRALCERAGAVPQALSAADVTTLALADGCALCVEAVDCFCAIFGSVTGNVAMTLGTLGGIYIGGGIVPRLGPLFAQSQFRRRFEDKGRLAGYLERVPTYVIIAEHPTFLGLSAILAQLLKPVVDGAPMLGRIRQARERMSPSECKVADRVLRDPRAVLALPIAAIALEAGVSQPTVMRFCHTIGTQGLADFKLKLASGLSAGGAIPVAHCHVELADSDAELARKVLGNNASAALALRDMFDAGALGAGIALLGKARRVELFGTGSAAMVAQDMQEKLLNLGIVSNYFAATAAQQMSAGLLTPDDVALVISRSGEPAELLKAVKVARQRGAAVLALTASGSPLARLADVLLPLNHPEGSLEFVPMIVRLLQLMMLDILAVGVARRQPVAVPTPASPPGTEGPRKLKLGSHLE